MTVRMTVHFSAPAERLARRFTSLEWLRSSRVKTESAYKWTWDETGHSHYRSLVVFFGKTGYGKSTTINKLVGHDLFEASAYDSCTKRCQGADYVLGPDNFFSFVDLPGIGESMSVDEEYIRTYEQYLDQAQAVVYLLRADQRDLSLDGKLLERLRKASARPPRIIYALNYCDQVPPISRALPFRPGLEQRQKIAEKQAWAARMLNVPERDVVPYSADAEWQVDNLMGQIGEAMKMSGAFTRR